MPIEFRGIQLDLARQMETVEYVREFTDFAADSGFNALVLYLEARVRTKSFPDPAPDECYEPDDMRKIVAHAAHRGIEVVPVVSNLGHAELFLKHARCAPLAELRGGESGRMSDLSDAFCPSLDATYDFFGEYFAELADIFPSKYFHVGCDEAWNVGICDLCRPLAKRKNGQAEIFLRHLTKTREIVTGRLGKRMLMWDDLFEFYPSALEGLPRDVVLCCWNYDPSIAVPKAHFANLREIDHLALYEKLGFDAIFCPVDRSADNIRTFSEYADGKKIFGALLTNWEKGRTFNHEHYPNVRYAGKLWQRESFADSRPVQLAAASEVLGISDAPALTAVSAYLARRMDYEFADPRQFLRGPLDEYERERMHFTGVVSAVLTDAAPKIPPGTPATVFENIRLAVRRERLQHVFRTSVPELYAALVRKDEKAVRKTVDLIRRTLAGADEVRMEMEKMWAALRPGVRGDKFHELFASLAANFEKTLAAVEKLPDTTLLHVRFFQADQHSKQRTEISIPAPEPGGWKTVAGGCFKSINSREAYYRWTFPIFECGQVDKIRIETWGYGGQGFSWCALETCDGLRTAQRIVAVSGDVTTPHNILANDTSWCMTGETDTTSAYLDPAIAGKKHTLEIGF